MKILFVVPYVPNLIRVRSYNFIRSLAKRGHQVTVLTVYANAQEAQDVRQLVQEGFRVVATRMPRWRSWWNCLWALADSRPLQAVYSWRRNLLAQVSPASFDVIHVEHLRGSQYGLELKRQFAKLNKPPLLVWDSVDCISLLFRQAATQSQKRLSRFAAGMELHRTEKYEGWLLEQFNQVLVSSSIDKHALLELSSGGTADSISVTPNGVDLGYFQPNVDVSRDPATIVVSGKMSYHANITMVMRLVNDIMPYVWAKRPDAKVQVVGKNPPREIKQLALHPAVTVTGAVDDIRPFLQRVTVAVVPLVYGAGSQFKVLEAMACATPTVCTPKATAALEVMPGRDTLVAREPREFAESVVELLDDQRRQREIGQAGRQYVEKHHNWDNIAMHLEGLYNERISAAH